MWVVLCIGFRLVKRHFRAVAQAVRLLGLLSMHCYEESGGTNLDDSRSVAQSHRTRTSDHTVRGPFAANAEYKFKYTDNACAMSRHAS